MLYDYNVDISLNLVDLQNIFVVRIDYLYYSLIPNVAIGSVFYLLIVTVSLDLTQHLPLN